MTNQATQTMLECTCRDNEGCTKPCDRKACQPVPLTEELLIEAAILSGDTPQERRLQKVLTQAAAALAQTAGAAGMDAFMAKWEWLILSRCRDEFRADIAAMLASAPAASGVDTSTNEAWAARAQEKIAAMESAASVSERQVSEWTKPIRAVMATLHDEIGWYAEAVTKPAEEALTAIGQALTQQRGECYCQSCKGSGEVIGLHASPSGDPQDAYEAPMACPKCDGTGDAK